MLVQLEVTPTVSSRQATYLTVSRRVTQQEVVDVGVIVGVAAGSVALLSALAIGAYKLGHSGCQCGKVIPEGGR